MIRYHLRTLLLVALATWLPGCATWEKSTYAALTIPVNGLSSAAKMLPGECEKREMAAVALAITRENATAAVAKIKADCDKAAQGITGGSFALKSARDGVHDAALSAAAKDKLLPLIALALKQYADLVPLLKMFGINLPALPGGL